MNADDLKDRLAELARLKENVARLSKEKTEAEKEMKRFQANLWQDMEEAGFRTYGHVELGTFTRKSTTYGTITDREAFLAWCKESEVDDLYKEVEVDGRLNELVRSRLDNGEELPPGVDFYTRDYISLTK